MAAAPAAEAIPAGPLASCDATASGAEDGQVSFSRGFSELCFCGHHADRYVLFLLAGGWRVTRDDRDRLAARGGEDQ